MVIDRYIENEIESIKISKCSREGDVVAISLVDGSGRVTFLRIIGIKYFLLNEMSLQNIVEYIRVMDSSADEGEMNEARDALQYILRGGYEASYSLDGVVDQLIEDIRNGVYLLVEIVPVYGCNISALAKRIEFVEGESKI